MAVQISSNSITVPQDGTFDRNVTIGGTLTYDDVTNIDSVGLVTARTGIEIGARPGVAASISADGNMIVSGISTFDGTVKVGSGCTITTGAVFSLQSNANPQINLLDDNNGFAATNLKVENGGRDFKVTTPQDTIFVQGSTESARIDENGRLLVGATESDSIWGLNSYLQVEGQSADASAVSISRNTNDAGGAFLTLAKSRGTSDGSNTIVQDGDACGTVAFIGADGGDKEHTIAYIQAQVDGTPGANDLPGRLRFNTTADGASSSSERMRIDSGGRILIGTSSDSADVGLSPILQVEDVTGAPYGAMSAIYNGADAVGARLYLGSSRGTANGATTVVQSGDQLGAIFFVGADGTDRASRGASIQCHVDGTPGGDDMPGRLTFRTSDDGASGSTERMRITSAGLVGIGEDSPQNNLHINQGDSDKCILQFTNTTTSSGSGDGFQIGLASNEQGLINMKESAPILFKTADTERMRIGDDGDLSLGTTNHNSKFTLSAGTVTNALSIRNTTGGNGTVGMLFSTQDHSSGREKAGIFHVETHGEAHYGGDLLFCLNSATGGATQVSVSDVRMRVQRDGNVLIGKATGSAGNGGVAGIECHGGSNYLMVTRSSGTTCYLGRNTDNGIILNFLDDGSSVGSVSTNGNSLPSDRNYKKNINSLPLGLNLIEKLNPISYNYKFENDGDPLKYGLIAQDLEKSLEEVGVEKNSSSLLQYTEEIENDPNLNDDQSKYSLVYDKLIPVLINAVKELSAEVKELKSKS